MKKKLRVTGVGLLVLLLVLVLAGFMYETINYRSAQDRFPPEGEMVTVGDRDIHVYIKGKKTDLPPVVIETGTGNWSYDWSSFQEEMSKHTQVLTYDRAGYGYSDPPSAGFSLHTTISDLDTIVEETGMDTPFILIGHSVGGVYARHFADQQEGKVAGVILVDARNEFFKEAAPEYNKEFFRSQDQKVNLMLSRFGVIRLLGERTLAGMPDFMSKEKYAQVHYDVPFFKVMDKEIQQIPENVEALKQTSFPNNVPLTIITPEEADSQAEALGFSETQADEINREWIDAQKQLVKLSSSGTYLSVPDSSHAVMYDQPEVIIEAVLSMGNALRK